MYVYKVIGYRNIYMMKHGERFTICHEGECLVTLLYTRCSVMDGGYGLKEKKGRVVHCMEQNLAIAWASICCNTL